jgi:small subunit ribosomal protein S8
MVTDPIADLLVRLQNASRVGHDAVTLPYSMMKHNIAKVLNKEGYVGSVEKKGYELKIELKYDNGRPVILGSKRISKPSRRMYLGVRDVKPIKRGHGLLVMSTPAGILSGKEAQVKRLGGEALFEIW